MGRTTITRITRIVFLVWLIVTAILLWHSIRPRDPVPHARPGALHALRDGWSLHILTEDRMDLGAGPMRQDAGMKRIRA